MLRAEGMRLAVATRHQAAMAVADRTAAAGRMAVAADRTAAVVGMVGTAK